MERYELIEKLTRLISKENLYYATNEQLEALYRINSSISPMQLTIKIRMIDLICGAVTEKLDMITMFLKSYEEIERIYFKILKTTKEDFVKKIMNCKLEKEEMDCNYEERLIYLGLITPDNLDSLTNTVDFKRLLEEIEEERDFSPSVTSGFDVKKQTIDALETRIATIQLEINDLILDIENASNSREKSEYMSELAGKKHTLERLNKERDSLLQEGNNLGGRK